MFDNGKGSTILIVEEDANSLHVMRDYLARANFQVRVAANGWEALKRIKDASVDLVISELNIADMDGCSLREKLLLDPQMRDIPFLFLVSGQKPEVLIHALRSGVDDCITKPFDPIVLVARVQAVIERRLAYERMVRVDPLTRLLNRPTLESEIAGELSRVTRYGRFGSMVLIGVDNFEQVNTEAGFAMGDLLLTCLSGVVLTSIRNVDIAGRYHSEETLLYLPETEAAGAEAFTRRIQEQLAAIADNVAGYELTFTSGIVSAPEDGTDLQLLLQHLEGALQHAKQNKGSSIAVWRRDVPEALKQADATSA